MTTTLLIIVVATLIVLRLLWISPRTSSYIKYVIDKGRHYSYIANDPLKLRWKVSPLLDNRLRFSVVFGIGCKYDDMSLEKDRFDINKLYGIQYALTPSKGSARIGWRWDSERHRIVLYGYVHHDWMLGRPEYQELGVLAAGEQGVFRIHINKKEKRYVSFDFDRYTKDQVVIKNQVVICLDQPVWWLKFRLWPYFGGNQVAPQSMNIFIKEI